MLGDLADKISNTTKGIDRVIFAAGSGGENIHNGDQEGAKRLMDGNTILYENLKHARVEENQLISKLREANVLNYNQVFAVVLESTNDISLFTFGVG